VNTSRVESWTLCCAMQQWLVGRVYGSVVRRFEGLGAPAGGTQTLNKTRPVETG
jgi:hypothetical protein